MSTSKTRADLPKSAPKDAAPPGTALPPMPPEGKPFQVGATTATVTTHASGGARRATLRLKRTFKASPEKVFAAFLDPDALAKWLPPDGFVGKVHAMDARVGGRFRMSFQTVNKSWTNFFGGTYLEIVPHRKLVYTDEFETDDPNLKGAMRVTITFTPVPGGTELEVVQDGIPMPVASGSPYGWAQSFDNLARLVEPELPF